MSFFLAFSIPAGLGTAFLYPSIQSCAQKWYAGRKGLATGVIGGAVGLSGAFLTVFVRTALRGFGIGAGHPGRVLGAGSRSRCPSALRAVLLLQRPAGKQTKASRRAAKMTIDLSPWQMLKTKQYWLCAGAVCFSTPAVLLFSPIILKLGVERGLDESAALWSVVLGSVGSAAGRLLMPMLSDKIGRSAHRSCCCLRCHWGFRQGLRCAGLVGDRLLCRGLPSAIPALQQCCPPFPPICSACRTQG